MKNILLPTTALAVPLLCCCIKDSPNCNNPLARDLPQTAFEIDVREMTHGFHSDSVYTLLPVPDPDTGLLSYSSGVGPNGKEYSFAMQRGPLVATPDKEIIFISNASVNASSSSDAIDIERPVEDDFTAYRLVFRHDGESLIRFWNGSSNEYTIPVRALSQIPLEGIEIRLGGQAFALRTQKGYSFDRSYSSTRLPFHFPEGSREDPLQGCLLELIPIPFNATSNGNTLEIRYDFGQLTVSPDGGGIYTWNLSNYPSLRWFNPNASTTVPPSFYQLLTPSDMLGRRIWIWNSSASLELAFKKSDEPLFWCGSIQTYLFPE